MARVAVIGAGSWGTTFAKVLVDAGNEVTLWSRRPELTEELNSYLQAGKSAEAEKLLAIAIEKDPTNHLLH